jgi:hypothetical protein
LYYDDKKELERQIEENTSILSPKKKDVNFKKHNSMLELITYNQDKPSFLKHLVCKNE